MGAMRQRGVAMDSPEIEYPESDGQPMAETDLHWQEMVDLALMLKERYRDVPDAYVASNLFVYYHEGDPRAVMAPDVFVAFGAAKGLRWTYKVWKEGVVPAVVIEATSRKTRREDLRDKKDTCARLGVSEYWLYDPYGEYLHPALQGFRLVAGEYVALPPDATGALPSAALGLTLHLAAGLLVLTDVDTGERLARPQEAVAWAAATAEAERRGAALERRRAEAVREQLAAETRRTKAALAQAEAALARATSAEVRANAERRRAEAAEAQLARMRGTPDAG
jgi:Uma2 family endonuclease